MQPVVTWRCRKPPAAQLRQNGLPKALAAWGVVLGADRTVPCCCPGPRSASENRPHQRWGLAINMGRDGIDDSTARERIACICIYEMWVLLGIRIAS